MLSQISQTKKDRHHMILFICEILKKKKKKRKPIDTENRLMLAKGEVCVCGRCAKRVKEIKSYKLPIIISVSHKGVNYSMETIINNTILYICKMLNLQSSLHKKKLQLRMVIDANKIHHGDHFAIYTNI